MKKNGIYMLIFLGFCKGSNNKHSPPKNFLYWLVNICVDYMLEIKYKC